MPIRWNSLGWNRKKSSVHRSTFSIKKQTKVEQKEQSVPCFRSTSKSIKNSNISMFDKQNICNLYIYLYKWNSGTEGTENIYKYRIGCYIRI